MSRRQRTLRVFTGMLLTSLGLCAVAGAELLLDEPFAGPESLSKWRFVAGNAGDAAARFEPELGHSSNGCIRVEGGEGDSTVLRYSGVFPVAPGTRIAVEGYGATRLPRRQSLGGSVRLRLAWLDAEGNTLAHSVTGKHFDNTDFRGWVRLAGGDHRSAFAPPDGASRVQLEIAATEPASPFIVDDIRLGTVPADEPQTWFGRQLVSLNGKWQMLARPWTSNELDVPKPAEAWTPYWVPGYTVPDRSGEAAWVRRTFTIPGGFDWPRIVLHFERVQTHCAVFLNGERIGDNLSDDLPFRFDVSDKIKRQGRNELMLFIRNWLAAHDPPIDSSRSFADACWTARRKPERRITHSTHWDWEFLGIPCDVVLLGTGRSYVKDVAICSRLNPVTLSVRGRVGGMDRRLTVACDVLNGEEVVLAFPNGEIKDAGFAANSVLPNATLWWPDQPHLYVLRTRLLDAEHNVVDEHRERFGIRTVETKGDRMLLNGVPMRFRNSSNWFPTYRCHDPYSRRDMVKCFQWLRSINVWTHRAHASSHPRLVYQAADEAGMLMIAEPPAPLKPLLETEDGYRDFYERWTRLTRNNPSVFLRSIMNEFFSEHMEPYEKYRTPVEEIVAAVRALQPDLPITFESDLDVYGLVDVLGLHYPDAYAFQSHWPDDLYWTHRVKHIATPAYMRHKFQWDRKKPLHIGEFGWMNWFSPDLDAALLGDCVYQEPFQTTRGLHDIARAFGWFGMIEAYRNQGVTGMGAWTLFENGDVAESNPLLMAVKQAYAPLVAFPRDYHAHGFSGADVTRRLILHNDLLQPAEVRVRWRHETAPEWSPHNPADAHGYSLAESWRSFTTLEDPAERRLVWQAHSAGAFDCVVEPAGARDLEARIRLPETDRRLRGRLRIDVQHGGSTAWTGFRGLDVWPTPTPRRTKRRLMLYDGVGQTRECLQAIQAEHHDIAALDDVWQCDGGILLIGAGALDDRIARSRARLAKWIRNGGRVICLAQDAWPAWLPVDTPTIEDAAHSIAHVRAPTHDLMKAFAPGDFRFWAPDHVVARKMFAKPKDTPGLPLIDIPTPQGLTHTGLLEMPWGRGTVLLCSLAVTDRIADAPVADALLREMIRYVDGYDSPARQVLLVETDDAVVREKIAALRLDRRPFDMDDLGPEHLLVVSHPRGDWSTLRQSVARVRAAVARGATLYMHDLDDDGLEFVRAVSGQDFRWVGDSDTPLPVHVLRNSALTRGLSSQQLNWYDREAKSWFWQLLPFPGRGVTADEDTCETLVSGGRLVRVGLGRGQVVIDQVPWHNAPANEAEATRYLNILMTNLGAMRREADPAPGASADFFSVDLRPHCTMGFADEVEGDGKGGATDQGPTTDLRSLPVGRQTLRGVPFDIIDPASNGARSCVVLGNSHRLHALPREVSGISLGPRKAVSLYFLHFMAWARDDRVGAYRIHYAAEDIPSEELAIVGQKNIADWWNPRDVPDAQIAWTGKNEASRIGLYMHAWRNPHPNVPIESIDFVSFDNGPTLCLVAVTAQE